MLMIRNILGIMTAAWGFVSADMPVRADNEPLIIAHRGASGYLPEHTIEAYRLGIEQGADFIEPDLVMTKDRVLVARHDVYLSSTTNVATRPEFADRKRTAGDKTDWFVMDFTLAELKSLRARQAFPGREKSFDDHLEIATFDEIKALVKSYRSKGRTVGLHIEMKHPDIFKAALAPDLAARLSAEFLDLKNAGIPLYFQCFDGDFVKEMAALTIVPVVLLVGGVYNEESARYELDVDLEDYYDAADGFGLNKALIFNAGFEPNGLVDRLHRAEKLVHVWTVRNDALPPGFQSPEQELSLLFESGVDGFFTDFPGTAVEFRESVREKAKGRGLEK